jgi:hypothetical protein
MRIVVALAVLCIAACASEKLVQGPPPGVDFSGHWKLNEADSDDPQRLIQVPTDTPGGIGQSGSGGGTGGRGSRQGGGRGGPQDMGYGVSGGPVMPSLTALGEGLRWPGKQLEIKQADGVVAFTSDGNSVVCQPMEGGRPHPGAANHEGTRVTHSHSREMPPPRCGWIEKTLVVKSGDPDDDQPPFEQHFSLSDDGRRLVEVVNFKGGRSSGFTLSRVWDRTT